MIEYNFLEFKKDIKNLSKKIKEYNPDTLIAIARGGLTPAHFLAEELNIRKIYTINAISYEKDKKLSSINIFNIPELKDSKKVLLIDDISDSGDTLKEIKKILTQKYPKIILKSATIFYKKNTKCMPDFFVKEAKEWINFFWEKDEN